MTINLYNYKNTIILKTRSNRLNTETRIVSHIEIPHPDSK